MSYFFQFLKTLESINTASRKCSDGLYLFQSSDLSDYSSETAKDICLVLQEKIISLFFSPSTRCSAPSDYPETSLLKKN